MAHITRRCNCVIISFLLFVWPAYAVSGQFQVSRVIDGDTIRVRDRNEKRMIIRLVGIDAPEASSSKNSQGQPFSQQATKHLAGLVLGRSVIIKYFGEDRYGRVLGEVFVDGENVNLQMVKDGLAEVYQGPPAFKQNLEPYNHAQYEARQSKKGVWQLGEKYVSPRKWRHSQ